MKLCVVTICALIAVASSFAISDADGREMYHEDGFSDEEPQFLARKLTQARSPRRSPSPRTPAKSPTRSPRASPRSSPRRSPTASPTPISTPLPRPGTCSPTPSDMLGPYYQAEVPFKPSNQNFCQPAATSASAPAVPITITGKVYDAQTCSQALTSGTIEIWQADNTGNYDLHTDPSDHNCRSKVNIGADGSFSFTTIVPARYGSSCFRPSHIHYMVKVPGYTTLVSQIYFVGSPIPNANDCGCGPCPTVPSSKQTTRDANGVGKFDIYLAK